MHRGKPLNSGQRLVLWGLGLLMLALAVGYLAMPEQIEKAYGLAIPEQRKYGMHYAVSVRDGFYGLLILTLTRLHQRRSLAVAVGLGILLPLGDACIVLFHEGAGLQAALPHLAGVVMLVGVFLYIRL